MKPIHLDAGIGDCFALQSYFPEAPTEIHWSSRARKCLEPLFKIIYPKTKHVNCWEHIADEEHGEHDHPCPPGIDNWHIGLKFQEIKRGKYKFNGSSFLKHKMGDVTTAYGKPYYLIQHDTPWNPEGKQRRFLDVHEWMGIFYKLEAEDCIGVVVNSDDAAYPLRSDRIIDLTGETTMGQSIEILKQAVGYIGIDSCMACLACQLFPPEKLMIQSTDRWYALNKEIYCAPHKTYNFIKLELYPKPIQLDTRTIHTYAPQRKTLMKVEMIKQRVHQKEILNPGRVYELEEKEALTWIKLGSAKPYIETPPDHGFQFGPPDEILPIETTAIEPEPTYETAVVPRRKRASRTSCAS